MPHPLIPSPHPSLTPTSPAFSPLHMLSTNSLLVKRTVYIENPDMLKCAPLLHLLLLPHGDVGLYTVILNPPNTILTLDGTMHLQSRALRNSPKFNEIQCIVCAGKLVFLTMHSFYFVFKTFPLPISFSLSFLFFFF